jgi:hypothetical protein
VTTPSDLRWRDSTTSSGSDSAAGALVGFLPPACRHIGLKPRPIVVIRDTLSIVIATSGETAFGTRSPCRSPLWVGCGFAATPRSAILAGDPFEVDEAARRPVLDEVDDPLRPTGAVVVVVQEAGVEGGVCAHAAMVARARWPGFGGA